MRLSSKVKKTALPQELSELNEYSSESSERIVKKRLSINKILLITTALVIIVSLIRVAYIRYSISTDLQSGPEGQVSELIKKVGEIVVLPVGEEPTIATVSDLSKLQGQEFFAHATLGDKLLVYLKAGKAILYSPTLNKIIEIAPLNLNTSQVKVQPKAQSKK